MLIQRSRSKNMLKKPRTGLFESSIFITARLVLVPHPWCAASAFVASKTPLPTRICRGTLKERISPKWLLRQQRYRLMLEHKRCAALHERLKAVEGSQNVSVTWNASINDDGLHRDGHLHSRRASGLGHMGNGVCLEQRESICQRACCG